MLRTTKRVGALVLVAAMVSTLAPQAASASPVQARQSEDCFQVGVPELQDFRDEIEKMATAGEIDKAAAERVICDPRLASEYATETVELEPAPADPDQAYGKDKGCTRSGNLVWNYNVFGKRAMKYWQTLNWCWNKKTKKVSDWSGVCDGTVTGWGITNGWRWQGCTSNDFMPYVLHGSMPGGVHHRTRGKFSNAQPWVPDQAKLMSIWGHWSATCDRQHPNGKPLRGC